MCHGLSGCVLNVERKVDRVGIWERQFDRPLCVGWAECERILWANVSQMAKCWSYALMENSFGGVKDPRLINWKSPSVNFKVVLRQMWENNRRWLAKDWEVNWNTKRQMMLRFTVLCRNFMNGYDNSRRCFTQTEMWEVHLKCLLITTPKYLTESDLMSVSGLTNDT